MTQISTTRGPAESKPTLEERVIAKCRQLLDFVRNDIPHSTDIDHSMQVECMEFGISVKKMLERLGVTAAEYEVILQKSARHQAESHLANMRTQRTYADEGPTWVEEKVARAGLTLQDIGTSKEELSALHRGHCLNYAGAWLANFRSRGGDDNAEFTRTWLKRGGLSPEDIGATAKELSMEPLKGEGV